MRRSIDCLWCPGMAALQVFQAIVGKIIPGELGKHAVSEGTKAVTKYDASR